MTITVRPLQESELAKADRIFRAAFGAHLALDTPESFAAGAEYIAGRWCADPLSALAALVDGELVGTNFVAHWGSFGYFGPLTVDPSHWNTGVGQRLVEGAVDLLDSWEVRLAGLYTFADSVKHVALYQRFGFWPRSLTQLWLKRVDADLLTGRRLPASGLPRMELAVAVEACRRVADRIHEGLDLTREVRSVIEQGLGEVVVLPDSESAEAFAVCHLGEGSEAGPDVAYVKFGAALSETAFDALLVACESLAASRGLGRLLLGVNTARSCACRAVVEHGFAPRMQGIAMHRPNSAGFNHSDAWIADDWR